VTSNFPLIGQGTEGGIDLSSFLPPLSTPTHPATSNSTFGKAGSAVSGALGKAYDAVTGTSFLGLLFGSDYRYLTGIIGLLLIAAGIFLFKPVRETVMNVSKTATKGAALAA
jgi:hypothetical protein